MSASSNTSERGSRRGGRLLLVSAGAILLVAAACHLLVNQTEARRHFHRHKAAHKYEEYNYDEDNDSTRQSLGQVREPGNMKVDHSKSMCPGVFNDDGCDFGWAYAAGNLLEYFGLKTNPRSDCSSPESMTDCKPSFTGYPLALGLSMATEVGYVGNRSYLNAGGIVAGKYCDNRCLNNDMKIVRYLPTCFGPPLGLPLTNGASIAQIKALLDKHPLVAGAYKLVMAKQKADYITDYNCDYYSKYGSYIDHAVLIVGYGVADNGVEFFKVKNSQGLSWGANGYGYFRIDPNGRCNTFATIVYPEVKCAF